MEVFALQVGLCEQLLSHLSKYQQQDKEAPSTSSKESSASDAKVPFEGMKAVKKPDTSDGFEGLLSMSKIGKTGQGLLCIIYPSLKCQHKASSCRSMLFPEPKRMYRNVDS